jgi:hypothetical protein
MIVCQASSNLANLSCSFEFNTTLERFNLPATGTPIRWTTSVRILKVLQSSNSRSGFPERQTSRAGLVYPANMPLIPSHAEHRTSCILRCTVYNIDTTPRQSSMRIEFSSCPILVSYVSYALADLDVPHTFNETTGKAATSSSWQGSSTRGWEIVYLMQTGGGLDRIKMGPASSSLEKIHFGRPDIRRRCMSLRSAVLATRK